MDMPSSVLTLVFFLSNSFCGWIIFAAALSAYSEVYYFRDKVMAAAGALISGFCGLLNALYLFKFLGGIF